MTTLHAAEPTVDQAQSERPDPGLWHNAQIKAVERILAARAAAPDALRVRAELLLAKYAGRSTWVGYEKPRREAWGEIERDLRAMLEETPTEYRPNTNPRSST